MFGLSVVTIRCMEWSDQGVEQVSHLERLKSIMSSLSRRISSSGLDDFELVSISLYIVVYCNGH